MHKKRIARYLLLGFLLSGLVSCAGLAAKPVAGEGTIETQAVEDSGESQFFWWQARFINRLEEGESPEWVSDLMVADLVIEPVLEKYSGSLALWRFHRRAVHDASGHVFSFVFYSDQQTAAQVFEMIGKSPALELMMQNDFIEEYDDHDLESENGRTGLEDTSDGNWSPALQQVWPAYIMGASVLWLGLINQYIEPIDITMTDFELLVEDYQAADAAITAIWRNEGQHAFLHHLNALFGYAPMLLNAETNF